MNRKLYVIAGMAAVSLLPSLGCATRRDHASTQQPETHIGASKHTPHSDVNKNGAVENKPLSGRVHLDPEALKLANLSIEPAACHTIADYLDVTGSVVPDPSRVTLVNARAAGKILRVTVNVGDQVSAGEILATLESTQLEQAQAAFRQATARMAFSRKNLQMQLRLSQLGAFGQPPLERAQTLAITARGEADTAQSMVTAAQTQVTAAESSVRAQLALLPQDHARLKFAQSVLKRDSRLLKVQFISRQEWEQAQMERDGAQSDLETTRAAVAQAEAKIQTAEANMKAAQSRNAEAQRNLQVARDALRRAQSVYKGGFYAGKELATARLDLQQAALDQQAAADTVRLLGGAPGAGDILSVTAPMDGMVTQRSVTLGQTVTAETTLFTVIQLHTVWVELHIYPGDLLHVHLGQKALIYPDTARGRQFTGWVTNVGAAVDPSTRTAPVRCVIHNPKDRLKLGAFVHGQLALSYCRHVLAVPADAIRHAAGQPIVYVPAAEPGVFRPQPVRIGIESNGMVEILNGIRPGQRVVVRNAFVVEAQGMKAQLSDNGD